MKILSIDTTSDICGVSLLEDFNLICKLDRNTKKTHSENLMPMIEQAFQQANLTLQDIDLLVCDKGPGSFTGIRIGIATIKAFHDSLDIPCIGINALEVLAYGVKQKGLIASLLDCNNDQCYFALYELKNNHYTEILAPTANTITNILKICNNYCSNQTPITFVGSGADNYKNLISKTLKKYTPNFETQTLNSFYLGIAGLTKWNQNQKEDLLPFYLKKPQAQRQLEEKLKNVKIAPMTLEDINQISDTLNSDFDNFWNIATLKNEILSKNSHYLIATIHQTIIGFAGIKILLNEANIMNIVTKKDYRNQGIGTLLLENLINLSQKQKVNSITLEVMEENYTAIHLYKKFGFTQQGLRKKYYQEKNGLIMTKKL